MMRDQVSEDDGMASSESDPSGGRNDALIDVLERGRHRFLGLVADIRPELLRYCARMTGSVADGEDVVQDTLARASYELSQMKEIPALRPWLFRIAHNRAIDHWRREEIRAAEPLESALDLAAAAASEPENAMARKQAVDAALSCFLELAPAQRACVILKDVLDHSLEDIADELALSVAAVKAALHRGRSALRRLSERPATAVEPGFEPSAALRRYALLFNAHDWDAVRALLADDVRLDLVSQRKAAGRRSVGLYFGNYERLAGWHATPAWFDGRELLIVVEEPHGETRRYVIELAWDGDRVSSIRDFRYVPYIAQEGAFRLEGAP